MTEGAEVPRKAQRGAPAIDVLQEVLRRGEESYRFRAGSVDTKAGLVLGAAGVLVALVGSSPTGAGLVGQILACLAGLMSVLSLRPRRGPDLDALDFGEKYLNTPPDQAQLEALKVALKTLRDDEERLRNKNIQFTVAASLLFLAAGSIVAGAAVTIAEG